MVQDGRVAALWGGGIGWPGFTAMAAPGGARFIAPDADEIARILAKHALPQADDDPGRQLSGAVAPDRLGRLVELRVRAPDLPDDAAYRLARALHRGEAALGARLPQARETTAANTVAVGAARGPASTRARSAT